MLRLLLSLLVCLHSLQAQELQAAAALAEWLRRNGGTVGVQVKNTPFGQGVFTDVGVNNEVLLRVPMHCVLSAHNSTRAIEVQQAFDAIQSTVMNSQRACLHLILLLVFEQLKGAGSEWRPLLDTLSPNLFVELNATREAAKEMLWHRAPGAHMVLVDAAESDLLLSRICANILYRFGWHEDAQILQELFLWAKAVVSTRAVTHETIEGHSCAIIPFIHLMNHKSGKKGYSMSTKRGFVEVVSQRFVNSQLIEEIFDDYDEGRKNSGSEQCAAEMLVKTTVIESIFHTTFPQQLSLHVDTHTHTHMNMHTHT